MEFVSKRVLLHGLLCYIKIKLHHQIKMFCQHKNLYVGPLLQMAHQVNIGEINA